MHLLRRRGEEEDGRESLKTCEGWTKYDVKRVKARDEGQRGYDVKREEERQNMMMRD